MSPMRGDAFLLLLRALQRGLVPADQRDRLLALADSLPDDETDPPALLRHGLLTQAQLDQLLAEAHSPAAPHAGPRLAFSDTTTRPLIPGPGAPDPTPATTRLPAESPGSPPPFGEDYVRLEPIAIGGMGIVYRAWQQSLHRHVALKVMRPGAFLDKSAIQRFQIEAQSAARLRHPNIVSVHQVGVHEGESFFTMDLVDGPSLSRIISERRLPLRQSLELLEKVAHAVHYAHEQGIIHRDLKPGNILVDSRGEPLVTDFGLAKDLETEFGLSMSGAVLGTPSYMSPEQARGRSGQADARSDVYSLGSILYEMLTGRPPFQADSVPQLLHMIAVEDPVPPRRLNASVPADVQTICLKCLAKEPERRYQTAEHLADDLRCYLDARPISARPSSIFYRTKKHLMRQKIAATVAAIALLVAIALIAGWVVTLQRRTRQAQEAARRETLAARAAETAREGEEAERGRAEEAARQAREAAVSAGASAERASEEERKAKAALSDSLASHASRYAVDGQYVAAVNTCLKARAVADSALIRPIQWNAERGRSHTVCLVREEEGETVKTVAFSPDGTLVAAGSFVSGKVRIWNVTTGKETQKLKGHETGRVLSVAFSPDGKRLASGSLHNTVRLWDIGTGELALSLRNEEQVYSVAFSPDGKLLAIGGGGGSLKCWDTIAGKDAFTLRGHTAPVFSLAFSPSGDLLASGGFSTIDHTIKIWDIAAKEEILTLSGHARPVTSLAFSPDGKLLASGSKDNTVMLWDVVTGKGSRFGDFAVSDQVDTYRYVAFTPDGRFLATGATRTPDSDVTVWDIRKASLACTLKGHGTGVNSLACSPDGKLLASGSSDGAVQLSNIAHGRPSLTFEGRRIAVSPDGRLLAYSAREGNNPLRLWDVEMGKEIAAFGGPDQRLAVLAFAPEGSHLASGSLGDGTVKLWDVSTGEEAGKLIGHTKQVWALTFSPDGKFLASGATDRTVRLWDMATRKGSILLEDAGTLPGVAFSPDGKLLATGSPKDNAVKLWDPATGEETAAYYGHTDWVVAVAFSRDGKLLASAGHGPEDPTVKVWDVATGKEIVQINASGLGASSLAFSPDGRFLATGSTPIKLWDVRTGKEKLTLYGHTNAVNSLAFSPDGRSLASGSSDETCRVWDVDPADNPELRLNVKGAHER